jgi:hypothetical protein
MEEEERSDFAEIIKKMQLLQEKQNSRKSKQDEKSKHYGNMADIIEKQETLNKESSAVYEKQLNDIDEQSNILLSEHKQFSKDLSKSIKSMNTEMSGGFDGLMNQHKAVCSDMSNLETLVEKGWQTHSDTLEQQLRQHAEAAQDDLQVQTSHMQVMHFDLTVLSEVKICKLTIIIICSLQFLLFPSNCLVNSRYTDM